MMNREPIRNRAVNAFAARQIQYRPPLTRVFAKAVSYLAAYIDNNMDWPNFKGAFKEKNKFTNLTRYKLGFLNV